MRDGAKKTAELLVQINSTVSLEQRPNSLIDPASARAPKLAVVKILAPRMDIAFSDALVGGALSNRPNSGRAIKERASRPRGAQDPYLIRNTKRWLIVG